MSVRDHPHIVVFGTIDQRAAANVALACSRRGHRLSVYFVAVSTYDTSARPVHEHLGRRLKEDRGLWWSSQNGL